MKLPTDIKKHLDEYSVYIKDLSKDRLDIQDIVSLRESISSVLYAFGKRKLFEDTTNCSYSLVTGPFQDSDSIERYNEDLSTIICYLTNIFRFSHHNYEHRDALNTINIKTGLFNRAASAWQFLDGFIKVATIEASFFETFSSGNIPSYIKKDIDSDLEKELTFFCDLERHGVKAKSMYTSSLRGLSTSFKRAFVEEESVLKKLEDYSIILKHNDFANQENVLFHEITTLLIRANVTRITYKMLINVAVRIIAYRVLIKEINCVAFSEHFKEKLTSTIKKLSEQVSVIDARNRNIDIINSKINK